MSNNNAENLDFCLKLLHVNNENEVSDLLRSKGYLNREDCWRPLGNVMENFSIVGNQQNAAVAALAEKIVNSIDAVMIDECKRRGIDPRSDEAPQSMTEAIERFFSVKDGLYENVSIERRRELAARISLTATGSKDFPCYTIVDSGEGQSPEDMPNTLLSLPGSNPGYKSRIKFVQGIFNMGGTGVLPFCGLPPNAKNYELIISKKDPLIESEKGSGNWGFSIVRRQRPRERHSSSTYEYLIPGGQILSFHSDNLPLLPGNYPDAYDRPLKSGTCIKLYNYQIGELKTNILLDFLYELNRYFYRIGLPIRLFETRDYQSNYYETTLSGFSVRLGENQNSIMEDNFPTSGALHVDRMGAIPASIYALMKKARDGHWLGNKCVVFTLNGQVHAHFNHSFLRSKEVGLYYSGQDVLVVLDCTDIPDDVREDIFMPSRDRLRTESPYAKAIVSELQKHLHKHEGLQTLEQKRRYEQLQEQFEDNKPLKEILSKLIKKAPTLALLFANGATLEKPKDFNYNPNREEQYKGKYFPTFFRTKDGNIPKECPINSWCVVSFETDAVNNYFSRTKDRGSFSVSIPEMFGNLTLWNGVARLRVKPPKKAKINEEYVLATEVFDKHLTNPFLNKVSIKIAGPVSEENNSIIGSRVDMARKKNQKDSGPPEPLLRIPNIVEVSKGSTQWNEFGFNSVTGVVVVPSTDKDYDLYVNMDNEYYQAERQNGNGVDLHLLRNQYKYGLALMCLAMIHNLKNDPTLKEYEIYDTVRKSSSGLAMTILPVLKSLGNSKYVD